MEKETMATDINNQRTFKNTKPFPKLIYRSPDDENISVKRKGFFITSI
jgi:hypothetical protein